MKALKLLILIVTLSSLTAVKAQDVHFSQFAMSPLLLNPALAGLNNGDYRAYANFRTQWNTIAGGNAYRTFAGGVDMAVGKASRSGSFAGIGMSFFSDQSGAAGFQTNNATLTAAYHIMMSKKRNMSLSMGLQGSFNTRGFDPSKATYDFNYDQVTGNINTNQKESFTRTKVYYGDVGAGLFYTATTKGGSDIYFGTGLSHINEPHISFFSGSTVSSDFNEKLYMKFTAHGGAAVVLSKKTWIIPNFFILKQGPASQYNVGAMMKMQLGNKILTRNFLYLGAQLRIANAMDIPMADAAIIHCRFDYKGLTVGLSYDINVSKLAVSTSTFGAPEVGVMYTIKAKHKVNQGYCPVMM
jgi:type IX secretion system PorP/SprF family membrane protein